MEKYSAAVGKDLLSALSSKGLLEYGCVIPGQIVNDILGITYPKNATRQRYQVIDLLLLAAVDYVRKELLNEGKYIAASNGDYRILLPSENVVQCERYMKAANGKLNRSIKLSRNTPRDDDELAVALNNLNARAAMKKHSIKSRRHDNDTDDTNH